MTAVVTAAGRLEPESLVATQGHVLTVSDLTSTLVVEAALHHLDLVVELDRPGPSAAATAVVRYVLEGLLGRPTPESWDDVTWALAATGRADLSGEALAWLGPDANRLPLLH